MVNRLDFDLGLHQLAAVVPGTSPIRKWYIAGDVSKVVEISGELSLSFNVSKCELISHDGYIATVSLLQSFPGHVLVTSHFLMRHFFRAHRLIRPDQIDVLSLQIEPDCSSGGPNPSSGFFQCSEGAPSAICCSPSVSHPTLPAFDRLLRLAIERITNSSDIQWLLASLPIKDGGRCWC